MTSEALTSKQNQEVNTLARKMAIALVAGLLVGGLLLFLRESLINNLICLLFIIHNMIVNILT